MSDHIVEAVAATVDAMNTVGAMNTVDAKNTDTTHLIVLMHGIEGDRRDMQAIEEAVKLSNMVGVETWNSTSSEGARTHSGIFGCAEFLWAGLEHEIIRRCRGPAPLKVSFVGHSMGALILRAVAARLHASPHNVVLDTLICVAAPHLGCRRLGKGGGGGVAPLMGAFGPTLMRAGLRLIKGRTGQELLLDDDTLVRLTDEQHLDALRAFRRRLAYVNGRGDWLVNAESCSLLDVDELPAVVALATTACAARESSVLWRPGADDARAVSAASLPSLHLTPKSINPKRTDEEAGHTLRLKPLPTEWDGARTAMIHSTWDDRRKRRAHKAAALLQRLRSAGEWEVHLAIFGKRSSFAGGVFSPHIDLIALPHKVTQPHGREVVQHLVANLLELHERAPDLGKKGGRAWWQPLWWPRALSRGQAGNG